MAKNKKPKGAQMEAAYKQTKARNHEMLYTGTQSHEDKRRKADRREMKVIIRKGGDF